MSKQKMNNLLVGGKKMALIALMSLALSPKAKAYDERAYMTPSEQTEYQTNGVLPSDIEEKSFGKSLAEAFLLYGSIVAGLGIVAFANKKAKEQK